MSAERDYLVNQIKTLTQYMDDAWIIDCIYEQADFDTLLSLYKVFIEFLSEKED